MSSIALKPFDEETALDTCATEPIHIPGAIQPRGVLLGLDRSCEQILFASENAATHFALPMQSILGVHAAAVLGILTPVRIRLRLAEVKDGTVVPITVDATDARRGAWVMLAHRFDDRVIVELIDDAQDVPFDEVIASAVAAVAQSQRREVALPQNSGIEPLAVAGGFQRVASMLASDPDLLRLCDSTAREVRRITKYDRVMVYQFDSDGHGAVIAEACDAELEPFLGLHYPASDIPLQARALYLKTRVRVLGNVSNKTIPLVAFNTPSAARPLDLSFALLRSMSPVHRQYLQNMGVSATMAVSIIVDGRLWGLIACHHMSPIWPSYSLRTACDLLSEFISVQVTVQESYARAHARALAASTQGAMIQKLLLNSGKLEDVGEELRAIVPCGGLAILSNDHVWSTGEVPPEARVRTLARWLGARAGGRVIVCDSLEATNPAFADISDVASGMLALDVSGALPGFVMWFRPQHASTVRWAGAPVKSSTDSGGVSRLSPRGSFEEWVEIRRGFASPWLAEEVAVAEGVRAALVEVVLELLATRHKVARLEFVRIRSAVEAASIAIAIEDESGHGVYVNPAFQTLTGYDGASLHEPRRVFNLSEQDARAIGVQPFESTVEVIAFDDSRIPVTLQSQPLRDDAGRAAGTLFIATDLRPLRVIEDERRRLEQSLVQRQKLESLGVLAGGIAHDFNNLLTTIVLNATLALQELPPSSSAEESINAITNAAQHATLLCRQLLAYAGSAPFVVQTINVNNLLKDMMGLLRTATQSHAVPQYDLAPNLPTVEGDVAQIRQVFMNLIVNASDAIGVGTGTIHVTTAQVQATRAYLNSFPNGDALAPKAYIEIRVVDTGCGMSDDTARRIFDPFFTTKFTGRGLGLAAVLGIVRGHEGAIRLESTLDAGTTFTVLLPVAEAPAVAPTPVERRNVIRGAGRTILVVDDEPSVQLSTKRVLERAGFHVLVANDGLAALDVIAATTLPVEMIVSDISMPKLSGLQMLARLRSDGSSLRVLLISGYSEERNSNNLDIDTRAHFLEKPFSIEQLLTAIAKLLAVI